MAGRRHIFIYEEHNDYGFLGFRLDNRPDFDPAIGEGIAHDMIEHPPLSHSGGNSLANEFMAFGAMVWVDYENGLSQRLNGTDAEKLGFNIHSLIIDQVFRTENRHTLLMAPKTKPLEYNDETLTEAIDCALKELISYGANPNDPDDTDDDYHTETYHFIVEHRASIVSWMRKGYRFACKRYRNCDQYAIGKLYEKVTQVMRDIERHVTEGEKVALHLNFSEYQAYAEVLYENKYYA